MDICPFTGGPCPHPKIAHATEIHEQLVQLDMCKICYGQYLKKDKIPSTSSVEFAENVVNFIETIFENKPVPTIPQEKRCDCGITIKDIIKTGKIGCDKCYRTFEDVLRKTVIRYHGANKHVGKIPKKQGLNSSLQEQIQALKIKMARAIEIENYEVAGILKSKIVELQQKINDS